MDRVGRWAASFLFLVVWGRVASAPYVIFSTALFLVFFSWPGDEKV